MLLVMTESILYKHAIITDKKLPTNRESDYPASLELHKIYRVINDKEIEDEGDIRIIDESGEDYIYPSSYFVPIQVPQTVEKSLLRTG